VGVTPAEHTPVDPAVTPAATPDPNPVPAAAPAVDSTPATPIATPAITPSTTPAAAPAAPGTTTKDAAVEAATVIAEVPSATTASTAAVTPAPIVPTAAAPNASASSGTTPDPGAGDSSSGSQTATPNAAIPTGTDTPQPATATIATDATQAPSLVVPAAVPVAATPVATVSALPQSLTTDRERFVRLVDGLEARLRVSGSEGGKGVRMTLRPAELGDVTVRLQIAADGQSATATLLAQNHQTGDLLAQAAGDLRQALADRGLRLDRLEVTAGSLSGDAPKDGAPSGAPNPNGQNTRRTHYAFDARNDALADPGVSEAPTTTTTHEGLYVLA
jgi:flagellar hook-length control protein FliK